MLTIASIIPCYNSSNTLEETIDSIRNQTRKCNQIIVVDDGSNDNTRAIVEKYPSVEYLRQANAGVSVARNSGAAKATSQWLAFCDADDIWHPEKLAIIERCVRHHGDCRFFFHNFYLFGDSLKTTFSGVADSRDGIFPFFRENKISLKGILPSHEQIHLNGAPWPFAPLYNGDAFRWLVLGNFILPSSVAIRRDFFEEIGGFDPAFRSAEETEFFLRVSKKTILHYIDLPLAGYRKSPGGLTGNIPVLLDNAMKALIKNAVQDPQIYESYKKVIDLSIARRYGRSANYWLFAGKRYSAFRMALKGLKHCFTVWQLWAVLIGMMLPVRQLSKIKKIINKNRGPFLSI